MASERGDLITPLAGPDGRAVVDSLVVAAPVLADLEAVGRSVDRLPSPLDALIVSGLSLAGGRLDTRGAAARVLTAAGGVSVRDRSSLAALRGVSAHHSDSLVPDPLTVIGRLTTPGIARRRIEYLRAMDRYPLTETVLVEVEAGRLEWLPEFGRRVKDAIALGYRITVVATAMPGGAMTPELQHAVERSIEPTYCLDPVCLDDLIAVMGSSVAVAPQSPALLAAACALGRPCLRLPDAAWQGASSIASAPAGVECLIHDDLRAALRAAADLAPAGEWAAQLDAHFDGIASDLAHCAGAADPGTAAASRDGRLEAARQSAWRSLADERLRFAERAAVWLAEIVTLKKEIARLTVREAALRQEMSDVSAHARHELLRAEHRHRLLAESLQAAVEESATRGERIVVLSNENANSGK